jgi:hypothetical protein
MRADIRYIPLNDNEQEVLQRMIEGQDVYVEIEGWGFHPSPKITAGDKRVQIRFPMEFSKPEKITVPVRQFVLILKTRGGREIFRDIKSTMHNFQPLYVTAGTVIDLIWDIALASIDPAFQDLMMPGIRGTEAMRISGGELIKAKGGR